MWDFVFSSYPDPPHLCFPPPQPTLGIDSSHNLIVYFECGMGLTSSSCRKAQNTWSMISCVWSQTKASHLREAKDVGFRFQLVSRPAPPLFSPTPTNLRN